MTLHRRSIACPLIAMTALCGHAMVATADVTISDLVLYLRADNVNGAGLRGGTANAAGVTTWTDLAAAGGLQNGLLNNFSLADNSGWRTNGGGVDFLEFSGNAAVNGR